ncbi:MAG: hypothetical protein E7573_03580 [Ruminococcaceae bacterium]|nr:hypothetical protein [Oscillospiraceae bacterium]
MQISHSKFTEFTALKNTVPSMVFAPEKETLEAWQTKAEEKLKELLGLPCKKCDLLFDKEYEKDLEKCTEIRFTFQSEEGEFVPAVMWLPKKTCCEKPPVMICLQGHGLGMHVSFGIIKYEGEEGDPEGGDRDFAVQCINNGIAAVAIDQRCFGERGGTPKPDCYTSSMTALLAGRTTIGGRVWDVMRLIDVLENEFSEVLDTEKIYCMGNSGGGTATFYATALEKRIKAAIPSCAFATFYGSIGIMYHCACNFVPGIAKYFDMAEIAGLIAPRPLVIVSGKEDRIFPLDTAEHEFSRLKDIYYKNCVSPENCIHIKGHEGHRFYAVPAWDAFKKLLNYK